MSSLTPPQDTKKKVKARGATLPDKVDGGPYDLMMRTPHTGVLLEKGILADPAPTYGSSQMQQSAEVIAGLGRAGMVPIAEAGTSDSMPTLIQTNTEFMGTQAGHLLLDNIQTHKWNAMTTWKSGLATGTKGGPDLNFWAGIRQGYNDALDKWPILDEDSPLGEAVAIRHFGFTFRKGVDELRRNVSAALEKSRLHVDLNETHIPFAWTTMNTGLEILDLARNSSNSSQEHTDQISAQVVQRLNDWSVKVYLSGLPVNHLGGMTVVQVRMMDGYIDQIQNDRDLSPDEREERLEAAKEIFGAVQLGSVLARENALFINGPELKISNLLAQQSRLSPDKRHEWSGVIAEATVAAVSEFQQAMSTEDPDDRHLKLMAARTKYRKAVTLYADKKQLDPEARTELIRQSEVTWQKQGQHYAFQSSKAAISHYAREAIERQMILGDPDSAMRDARDLLREGVLSVGEYESIRERVEDFREVSKHLKPGSGTGFQIEVSKVTDRMDLFKSKRFADRDAAPMMEIGKSRQVAYMSRASMVGRAAKQKGEDPGAAISEWVQGVESQRMLAEWRKPFDDLLARSEKAEQDILDRLNKRHRIDSRDFPKWRESLGRERWTALSDKLETATNPSMIRAGMALEYGGIEKGMALAVAAFVAGTKQIEGDDQYDPDAKRSWEALILKKMMPRLTEKMLEDINTVTASGSDSWRKDIWDRWKESLASFGPEFKKMSEDDELNTKIGRAIVSSETFLKQVGFGVTSATKTEWKTEFAKGITSEPSISRHTKASLDSFEGGAALATFIAQWRYPASTSKKQSREMFRTAVAWQFAHDAAAMKIFKDDGLTATFKNQAFYELEAIEGGIQMADIEKGSKSVPGIPSVTDPLEATIDLTKIDLRLTSGPMFTSIESLDKFLGDPKRFAAVQEKFPKTFFPGVDPARPTDPTEINTSMVRRWRSIQADLIQTWSPRGTYLGAEMRTRPYPLEQLLRGTPPTVAPPKKTATGSPDPLSGELGELTRPDGSVSTEISVTVTDPRINDGQPTNIPTLIKGQKGVEDLLAGKAVTDEQQEIAIKRAIERGGSLSSYDTIEEAVEAAKARSAMLSASRKKVQPKKAKAKKGVGLAPGVPVTPPATPPATKTLSKPSANFPSEVDHDTGRLKREVNGTMVGLLANLEQEDLEQLKKDRAALVAAINSVELDPTPWDPSKPRSGSGQQAKTELSRIDWEIKRRERREREAKAKKKAKAKKGKGK